tara:strand:- start:230 stop:1036 length:807 start_codon:yes stop_codon:yes gene_type:complete
MWNHIPWQGIGQRWDSPRDTQRFIDHGDILSFVEPSLPLLLEALPDSVPVLAHSSEIPLATSSPINPRLLRQLQTQVRQLNTPWAGEHFCLNSSIETGELGYNFAPILDETTLADTIANIEKVKSAYDCLLAIEEGPRYHSWNNQWDDLGFMLEAAQATNSALILDIGHHYCSVRNLDKDPTAGLTTPVLERIVEIHITGIGEHRVSGFYHDNHAVKVDEECWKLLTWALERTPHLKALTLEHNHNVPPQDYKQDLHRLAELVEKVRN